MRISIPGTDRGNAVFSVLILILLLSSIIIALVSRISAIHLYADVYKDKVIKSIEETNMEIKNKYDIY